MFVITLRFKDKARAGQLMDGHNAWIKRGFDDGVFLMVGSLQPNAGGVIFAHGVTQADVDARVMSDPFVAEGVVNAEVLAVAPGRIDERLAFLKA